MDVRNVESCDPKYAQNAQIKEICKKEHVFTKQTDCKQQNGNVALRVRAREKDKRRKTLKRKNLYSYRTDGEISGGEQEQNCGNRQCKIESIEAIIFAIPLFVYFKKNCNT